MSAKVLAKIEILAVADDNGVINYESDLTYYAPGRFALGCELLDKACDTFPLQPALTLPEPANG